MIASFDAISFDAMPEPPRGAIGGHLGEWLGVENARGVLERLLRYAEACGPVARVSLGPVRLVLISDAAVASEVLSDPRANHKGAAYVLTRVVLDNVLLLNGEAWRSHRKTYRAALRGVDAVGAARAVVARYADELARDAPPARVMLDELVWRLVGDVVGRFVAGVSMPAHLEPHRHRVQYELAAVGIDLQCRPWAYLSPARWWRLRASVLAMRAFFRGAVRARLAAPDDAIADVLNGFVALAREGEHPGDEDAIQEAIVNYFFTAHDVLASSTAWTLWLIAERPELQRRLRASLAADGDPDELRRVVKEGLRLFPGYGLFGRTTRAPMTIAGYHVPAGTLLIVSPFVTHRLDRHWPDASRFDPDRWRGRGTGTPPAAAHGDYLPFGSGARGCLASHLAFPVVETIVGDLVRRFDLRAEPDHDPGIVYLGTAYTKRGMPVRVTPADDARDRPAAPAR